MEPLNINRGVQLRETVRCGSVPATAWQVCVLEMCGVICVDYGVWGARGDPFGIWGVGVRLEPAETLHMGIGVA